METISQRIERLRAEKKITQTAIANALGKSQQKVSRDLGRDEANMTVSLLRGMSKILGVSVAELIGDDIPSAAPQKWIEAYTDIKRRYNIDPIRALDMLCDLLDGLSKK